MLKPSLHDLMVDNSNRLQLHSALRNVSVRRIQLGPLITKDRIFSEIGTVLSLTKNAIQLSNNYVEIRIEKIGGKYSRVEYPARSLSGSSAANRAAVFLSILKTVQAKVNSNETTTVRDLYYANVELYRNQKVVADWIKTLEGCFGVEKSAFRVVAAQKGKFCSPVELTIDNESYLGTNLVPYLSQNSIIYCTEWQHIEMIMVVEKDAVFHRLSQDPKYCYNKILITGKGYPDVLSVTFLRQLIQATPKHITFHVLADSDPYGIDIVQKYCQGVGFPFSNKLNYSGIFIRDLLENTRLTIGTLGCGLLLNLSRRDWNMSQRMLVVLSDKRAPSSNTVSDNNRAIIRRELQWQLIFFKKGEMNSVI
ncbi:HDR021Wp [Eremothecium sinecaudum]|uniref:DNA topoisomerase (ATP-hydrolyzing) n=1 Tax=Eremothecium sinecaudum TaxID=45286 RepID=A0A0X8HSR0_9SACH|nr:HDR021Wp [Eremothecium sinecaudum]AMD20764.1 HDR021Wp [Eremothecium sinecaudum]